MTAGSRARWNCRRPAGCGATACARTARSRRPQLDALRDGVTRRRHQLRPDRGDARPRAALERVDHVCDPRGQEPRGAQCAAPSRPARRAADPRVVRAVPAGRAGRGRGRRGADARLARPARREARARGGRGFLRADRRSAWPEPQPIARATTTRGEAAARSAATKRRRREAIGGRARNAQGRRRKEIPRPRRGEHARPSFDERDAARGGHPHRGKRAR